MWILLAILFIPFFIWDYNSFMDEEKKKK